MHKRFDIEPCSADNKRDNSPGYKFHNLCMGRFGILFGVKALARISDIDQVVWYTGQFLWRRLGCTDVHVSIYLH